MSPRSSEFHVAKSDWESPILETSWVPPREQHLNKIKAMKVFSGDDDNELTGPREQHLNRKVMIHSNDGNNDTEDNDDDDDDDI